MAAQTEKGKAFEYAYLKAIYTVCNGNQDVVIEQSSSLSTAKNYYESIGDAETRKMDLAALASMRVILRIEPQLTNPHHNAPLLLSIQEDARGIAGDVRDIVCKREQNGWEIGFSCKHNHFAVKHSRLSYAIDFGHQWFGKQCSEQYFTDIRSLFEELSALRESRMLWKDLTQKDERFYLPLLTAFIEELKRLDSLYPSEIPPALIAYLLGRNDFYKIIQ